MSETVAGKGLSLAAYRGTGLTKEQKRNLALASVGSLLEFYEFMVFGFFTVLIGKLFFPPDLPDAVKTFQAFALYSLGFVLRPVSGAIIGHLGDHFGRKKLFMVTVLLMALPTLLIGALPTYAQIGIMAPILLVSHWPVNLPALRFSLPNTFQAAASAPRADSFLAPATSDFFWAQAPLHC
jgi:MFS family permease